MTRLSVNLTGRVGDFSLDVQLEALGPVALIGPNGAGKSTLLLMALGVLRPRGGRLELGDRVLFDAAVGRNLPTELRRLGYLPQSYALFPHMTALDNVAFAVSSSHRGKRKDHRRRAMALLEELQVAELAHRRPRDLSGGEAQRVALARALGAEPQALLLDEPLAALDPGVRERTRRLLAERLVELGIPTLLVTHEAADVQALASSVVVLEGGKVVQHGTPSDLAVAPATTFVRSFFAAATSLGSEG